MTGVGRMTLGDVATMAAHMAGLSDRIAGAEEVDIIFDAPMFVVTWSWSDMGQRRFYSNVLSGEQMDMAESALKAGRLQ